MEESPVGRAAQVAVCKTADAGATPARDSKKLSNDLNQGSRWLKTNSEKGTGEIPYTGRGSETGARAQPDGSGGKPAACPGYTVRAGSKPETRNWASV